MNARPPPADPPSGPAPAHAVRAVAADAAARVAASSPLATPGGVRADPGLLRALRPVADLEAEAVAFAHALGEVPYARRTRARFFAEARARLRAARAADGQLAVVDLVAAMFDYVIDDRRLPEAARPLVWRLQQPVLLLALIDPGYLGDQARSLRTLIENLGGIAEGFGSQWVRGSELHDRLETVVRALEIVAANLYGRLRVLTAQIEREQTRSSDNVRRLVQRMERQRLALEATPAQRNRRDYARRPGREQERAVTEHVTARLAERTRERVLPDTVHQFLDQVWTRVLRTTALRDGQGGAAFAEALATVDDLLETVDERSGTVERAALAARIPGLIDRLHAGMRQIGARPEGHQDFFDELFLVHLRRLHRGRGARDERTAPPRDRSARVPPREPEAGEIPGATYYDVDAVPVLEQRIASLADSARAAASKDAGAGRGEGAGEAGAVPTVIGAVAAGPIDTRTGAASTQRVTVRGEGPTHIGPLPAPAREADNDEPGADRLLSLVESADLLDLPDPVRYSNARAGQQFARLSAGQWLEFRPSRDRPMRVKVVWINRRRSVAMLVRAPDRRAISRPMSELAELFRRGKLRLLEAPALAHDRGVSVG